MTKKPLLIVFLIVSFGVLHAQNWNWGTLTGAEWEHAFNSGLKINIEEELRWTGSTFRFDRSKTTLGLDYKLWGKSLRVGGDIDYIFKNKWDYFENRYRVQCNLSYSHKLNRWNIQNRVALMSVFYDPSRGYYDLNPELYLREKIKIEYAVFHKPIKFGLNFEFFMKLNHPEFNIIDELRSEIFFDYRFSKSHAITIFLRADNEIQVAEPENIIYLGVTYHFKK
jgi:hypothetical protein